MSISRPLTKVVLGCLTSLLLAASVQADTYAVVKVDARSMIMINIATITATPEGNKRAWVATAWRGRQFGTLYRSHDYIEYDCSHRRYRIISTTTYGQDDSQLKTFDYKTAWRRQNIRSDSYVGSHIVCDTLGVGSRLLTGDELDLVKSYRGTPAQR